jgi:enamine deaminase RidA (YjgF/YER057c/UK114 family)
MMFPLPISAARRGNPDSNPVSSAINNCNNAQETASQRSRHGRFLGVTLHVGDFRAQKRRTLSNITGLLESEVCTWRDIVRTTCYLRDIDRDYDAFNGERTAFYKEQRLDPLQASTSIQAHLCRQELLVEIEAIAMFQTGERTRKL